MRSLPARKRERRAAPKTFGAVLDDVQVGLVLLDRDLTVEFINRAFLHLWELSEAEISHNLGFEGLMRLILRKHARPLPEPEFNDFIRTRTMLIRAGGTSPRDVRLDNGSVIRVTCKPLPDGGRLLVYSDVTDLVQQADRLKRLAMTDALTGLFNRRQFLSIAETEWNRYQRYLRPMSLLMIDIDKFKEINDRFGHDVGDHVLVEVAGIIREHKRKSDVASRFGGEEFVVLLPETTGDEACAVAERLRQEVATRDFSAGLLIKTTVSIGAAEAELQTPSIFQLIKRADQAMYMAKGAGRNQVCGAATVQATLSYRPQPELICSARAPGGGSRAPEHAS
jgi:diguanylate cyclase (GGDEF)-like protein